MNPASKPKNTENSLKHLTFLFSNGKVNCLIIFLIFSSIFSFAQNKVINRPVLENLKFGIGGGYGVIYPNEINEFIGNSFDDDVFTSGFPEVVLSLNGDINVQYFVDEKVEMCAELGGAWAPKFVSGASPSYYYLTRVSPGFTANYHFKPMKNDDSFFIGAGINYNFLAFKFGDLKVKGNSPGGLIQIGLSSTFRGSETKYSLSYNFAKDKGLKNNYHFNELSFSGINFTAHIYPRFKKTEK